MLFQSEVTLNQTFVNLSCIAASTSLLHLCIIKSIILVHTTLGRGGGREEERKERRGVKSEQKKSGVCPPRHQWTMEREEEGGDGSIIKYSFFLFLPLSLPLCTGCARFNQA